MILDLDVLDALALEFVRRRGTSYIQGALLPADTTTSLGSETKVFSDIWVRNFHAETLVYNGTTVDTIDGFHASATPLANHLLALDANAVFPTTVYPEALLRSGDILTGNLDVAPGVTIDGVDINLLKAQVDSLIVSGVGVPAHSHTDSASGGDLLRYATADGQGTRAAHIAERLNKSVVTGNGLTGGGLMDQDRTISVRLGDSLVFGSSGELSLQTPGPLSATSVGSVIGGHTHAVDASSDPTGQALLRSDTNGGLRLHRFAVGTAAVPGEGNLAASGDITGNRVISTNDAFVGNDLSVGTSILNTVRNNTAVFINRETDAPTLQGALTVRPGNASQRGVVIQGKTGQQSVASLLMAANAAGQAVFHLRADGTLESGFPAFVSGLTGWRITGEGDAEFRNITARGELHTSVFVANEMHASGGTLAVLPTGVVAGPKAAGDNVMGAQDATFNLVISASAATPGLCPFALNDVLRLKLITE